MNLENFRSMFLQKMRHNKAKRLVAIEDYLIENFDLEVSFEEEEVDQCLALVIQLVIDNPDSGDEILNDIITLLQDRYSVGEPFFILGLETSMKVKELSVILKKIFSSDFEYESFDFTDSMVTVDEISKTVELSTRYSEFFIDPLNGERGSVIFKGNVNLNFELKNELCISSIAGYNKVVNKIVQYINDSLFPNVKLKQKYVQRQTRFMKDSATSDFDPLTLLVINLIFKKFTEMGYIVQSVDSLSFNNENAPRVKNAKLGGSDLFADPDVVERIYNGDKITKFTVNIVKLNESGKSILSVDLTIDFRGVLKFIFSEQSTQNHLLIECCQEIHDGIYELIQSEYSIQIGTSLLNENLKRHSFRSRGLYNQFVAVVKGDLLKMFPESSGELDKYFKETHNV